MIDVDHEVVGGPREPAVPVAADRAVHRVLQLLEHGAGRRRQARRLARGSQHRRRLAADRLHPRDDARRHHHAGGDRRSGRSSRRSSSRCSCGSASRRRRCSPPTASATRPSNVVTPLMAYFPLIVIFAQRYRKDAGIGTVVSMMLPVRHRALGRLDAVLRRLVPARDPARPGLARPSRLVGQPRRRRSRRVRAVSDSTITFVVLAVVVVVFIWDRLPVAVVAIGRRALAVGDGRPRPRPGAGRLRRPDGDLHRVAVRRQRGARRDRRHGLGRAAADRARGRQPDAADRPDDAARRPCSPR